MKIFIWGDFILLITILFFYFLFVYYIPLKNNHELFLENRKNDINYTLGKKSISNDVKNKYGIFFQDFQNIKGKTYIIDGREIEEFSFSHINNAKHIRMADITKDSIQKIFKLSNQEMEKGFFLIYCHDGTRSSEVIEKLSGLTAKFLINGLVSLQKKENQHFISFDYNSPIFSQKIQKKDFTIPLSTTLKKYKNRSSFFIDGRLYRDSLFMEKIYPFRISTLSSKDYDEKLRYIISNSKDIVFIVEIYPDLFYAKLFGQRLYQEYQFPLENFHILFGQSELFSQQINNLKK